jgi:hypothetical protein
MGWFLRQFAAYVDLVIAGQKESDMVNAAIVELALRDEQNLEAALRIGESLVAIRLKIATNLLRCVYDGLKGWAQHQDAGWEVVESWPGGNWIEQPDQAMLPLVLRNSTWPELVGVVIQAEGTGPHNIYIGIFGQLRNDWTPRKRELYGEQTKFVGHQSRQRIVEEIEKTEKGNTSKQSVWVYWDRKLKHRDGQDISDWRDIKTVTRLHSEKDKVCEYIKLRMTDLAAKISCVVIDET